MVSVNVKHHVYLLTLCQVIRSGFTRAGVSADIIEAGFVCNSDLSDVRQASAKAKGFLSTHTHKTLLVTIDVFLQSVFFGLHAQIPLFCVTQEMCNQSV